MYGSQEEVPTEELRRIVRETGMRKSGRNYKFNMYIIEVNNGFST